MPTGFMYLTVILDWYSRYVLSWRVSNTLDGGFCLEALEEACEIVGAAWAWRGEKGRPAITAIREALAEQPQDSKKFDPNESFEREEAAKARVREFMRNH